MGSLALERIQPKRVDYRYTKATGQTFAEPQYDAWGQPVSPNKLVNNDHGNYVFATFTGHIYDPVLDIYFAEARFYDSTNRTWLAMDPIKDGLNWYQYCLSNPTTNWDPTGLAGENYFPSYSGCDNGLLADWTLGPDSNDILRDELQKANNWMYRIIELIAGGYFIGGASSALLAAFAAGGAVAVPVAGVAAAAILGLVLVVDAVTGTTAAIGENFNSIRDKAEGYSSSSEKGNYNKVKDSYLKQNGIDAHELKRDVLGRKAPISQYDIYINKDTGELFIFKKGGKGIGMATGEFIK